VPHTVAVVRYAREPGRGWRAASWAPAAGPADADLLELWRIDDIDLFGFRPGAAHRCPVLDTIVRLAVDRCAFL